MRCDEDGDRRERVRPRSRRGATGRGPVSTAVTHAHTPDRRRALQGRGSQLVAGRWDGYPIAKKARWAVSAAYSPKQPITACRRQLTGSRSRTPSRTCSSKPPVNQRFLHDGRRPNGKERTRLDTLVFARCSHAEQGWSSPCCYQSGGLNGRLPRPEFRTAVLSLTSIASSSALWLCRERAPVDAGNVVQAHGSIDIRPSCGCAACTSVQSVE